VEKWLKNKKKVQFTSAIPITPELCIPEGVTSPRISGGRSEAKRESE
jgi:hypothetical protein